MTILRGDRRNLRERHWSSDRALFECFSICPLRSPARCRAVASSLRHFVGSRQIFSSQPFHFGSLSRHVITTFIKQTLGRHKSENGPYQSDRYQTRGRGCMSSRQKHLTSHDFSGSNWESHESNMLEQRYQRRSTPGLSQVRLGSADAFFL